MMSKVHFDQKSVIMTIEFRKYLNKYSSCLKGAWSLKQSILCINNPSMQNIKDTTSNFNRKYKKKMRSVSDRIM